MGISKFGFLAGMAMMAMTLGGCMTAGSEAVIKPDDVLAVVKRVQLTPKQTSAVQTALKQRLKDPDSAKFGRVAAGENKDGHILVCGEVNAKNSYGGYTGMEPYSLQIRRPSDEIRVAVIARSDEAISLYSVCSKMGLALTP